MAEQGIITPDDIREFYPQLSPNIADAKITPSILLAQQNDMEPFLGWYLYNEFIYFHHFLILSCSALSVEQG